MRPRLGKKGHEDMAEKKNKGQQYDRWMVSPGEAKELLSWVPDGISWKEKKW